MSDNLDYTVRPLPTSAELLKDAWRGSENDWSIDEIAQEYGKSKLVPRAIPKQTIARWVADFLRLHNLKYWSITVTRLLSDFLDQRLRRG
jgi:hypothetical protein